MRSSQESPQCLAVQFQNLESIRGRTATHEHPPPPEYRPVSGSVLFLARLTAPSSRHGAATD